MSADRSALSFNGIYGFDMVVATTQASVNATMKEWLSKYNGKPFTQVYTVQRPNGAPQDVIGPVDYEQLKKDLGFDPFTVPNGTAESDDKIKKMDSKQFMFGFQVELGLPANVAPRNLQPIVQFKKEGSKVTYNLMCKRFRVIDNSGRFNTKWKNLSQDDSNKPWIFSFEVDLDLRSDKLDNHFSKLPIETQRQIPTSDRNMFSIQQLYLNLNRAGLSGTPEIAGIDKNSTTAKYLSEVFIKQYLNTIDKDGVLLGYNVVSNKAYTDRASLVPTSMNFIISSYKQLDGRTPTNDFHAYTLNYLLTAKGKPMPQPRQFLWNWVDEDKTTQYAGVMAVHRATFVDFLHGLLSNRLRNIVFDAWVSVVMSGFKITYNYRYNPIGTAPTYNIVKNSIPTAHALTFSRSSSNSSDDWNLAGWGNMEMRYTTESNVFLEGTSIRVETILTTWAHVNCCGGVTEGNFARYKSVVVYTIGVDAYGRITVTKTKDEVTDHSDNISISVWGKIASAGTITGIIDGMKEYMKNFMRNLLSNDAGTIQDMLNGSGGWSFPGGRTFTFTEARFSDSQDLVCNVLYVTPTQLNGIRKNGLKTFMSMVRSEAKEDLWQEEPVGIPVQLEAPLKKTAKKAAKKSSSKKVKP